MIGIYKITSPSGKVYIGQSIDIEKRWKTYKSGFSKGQIKLHNSFVKYGIDNHVFQILEECLVESLNNKERYWQDFYNCIGHEGLNLKLTNSSDKSGSFSNELKLKLSNSSKGKKMSEESKIKMRNSNLGKKLSEETKKKIGEKIKGSKHSEETKNKISQGRFGQNNPNSRLFLNTDTGIFYFTFKEAADSVSYNKVTLWRFLNGKLPNKTSIIYC
jgi:group I intron endonuclease